MHGSCVWLVELLRMLKQQWSAQHTVICKQLQAQLQSVAAGMFGACLYGAAAVAAS
jgi:hypothetical protein